MGTDKLDKGHIWKSVLIEAVQNINAMIIRVDTW